MATTQPLKSILTQPIPDQTAARARKRTYRTYPILENSHHQGEPLVDIMLYGIAGQSYYSRPNPATGDPVPGVEPAIMLRKDIVELLASINHELQISDTVTELLGGTVELYVEEGARQPALQQELYEQVFPKYIAAANPDFTPAQVVAARDRLIAKPTSATGAPPHTTGAAIDITLRYAQSELSYVPKAHIPMGRAAGKPAITAVDYYERAGKLPSTAARMQRNRRIFYWIMRGALLQDDSGLVCNPDEWWHWSYGDQMWAALTDAPCAYYSIANDA